MIYKKNKSGTLILLSFIFLLCAMAPVNDSRGHFFIPSLTFPSDPVQGSVQTGIPLPVDGDTNLARFILSILGQMIKVQKRISPKGTFLLRL